MRFIITIFLLLVIYGSYWWYNSYPIISEDWEEIDTMIVDNPRMLRRVEDMFDDRIITVGELNTLRWEYRYGPKVR